MAKKRTSTTKKKPSKRKAAKKAKRNSQAIQVASVTTTLRQKNTEKYWQNRALVAERDLDKIKSDLKFHYQRERDELDELRDFRDTEEGKIKEEARVRDWNVRYPSGTPVTITLSDGTTLATKTHGEAYRNPPDGRGRVQVELGSYVFLENVQVAEVG